MSERSIPEDVTRALADRYRIERELGRGGMATVYLAEDLRHHRKVALKVLRPELAAALGHDRFLREISTTANLRHPHILPLYDSGTAGDALYYVMPFVEGESLRDRLDRERQLPLDEALEIVREVGDALGYAHEQGIVHRDIKPDNILLERGHATVADFGIARAVDQAGAETLTQTGMAVGTAAYMSPEQSTGESTVDGRSDLYSLGCVLYEMLAGEPPYSGASAQAVIAKRLTEPVPRVSTLRESVPVGVERALTRVLAKSPADRPRSARDLLGELASTSTTTSSSPVRSRVVASGRALRWIGGLAAGAVVAILAATLASRQPETGNGELSQNLIAVVPFTVRGSPEFDYLGEGMVDLLSAKLDGAGALNAVSPRLVLASGKVPDPSDLQSARRLAERVRAGRYVSGSVLVVGDRLQLTAYLHETRLPEVAPVPARMEGRAADLFDVIDSLATRLLAGTMTGQGDRLKRLASATTASLPALKDFLQGERFMRAGRYRDAELAYDAAVALDSTFALAWYRKTAVAEWTDSPDVRLSADRAFQYADRVSPRDRSLFTALRHRRYGRNHEAEEAYLAHLRTWPDEIEAYVYLGEIYFHDNPRRGRPIADAIPMFERALGLDPTNSNARIHLARLYAMNRDLDSLSAVLDAMRAEAALSEEVEGVGNERLFEVEALHAWVTGDTARQRTLQDQLSGLPWFFWFYVAHGVARFAHDPASALAIAQANASHEPLVSFLIPLQYVVLGQERAMRTALRQTTNVQSAMWHLYEAAIWTSGAVEPDTSAMEALLARLHRTDPEALRRSFWVTPTYDLSVRYAAFERDYFRALLLIHLGRVTEAGSIINAMTSADSLPGVGNLQADALNGLEAEVLLHYSRREEALARLRRIGYQEPHAITYQPLGDGTRSRYVRAELELAIGDTAVAEGLFRGFDESWSPWDTYYRPIAYRRLAEIAEARGQRTAAAEYYTRLLALWQDSDPGYDRERDAIRLRRDALLRG